MKCYPHHKCSVSSYRNLAYLKINDKSSPKGPRIQFRRCDGYIVKMKVVERLPHLKMGKSWHTSDKDFTHQPLEVVIVRKFSMENINEKAYYWSHGKRMWWESLSMYLLFIHICNVISLQTLWILCFPNSHSYCTLQRVMAGFVNIKKST